MIGVPGSVRFTSSATVPSPPAATTARSRPAECHWRACAAHVEAVDIEIDHAPGRGWFSAGGKFEVRVRGPVPDQEPVTCVIPGHHREGRELISELIEASAGPLAFSVRGRCAYESTFEYSSDEG